MCILYNPFRLYHLIGDADIPLYLKSESNNVIDLPYYKLILLKRDGER